MTQNYQTFVLRRTDSQMHGHTDRLSPVYPENIPFVQFKIYTRDSHAGDKIRLWLLFN